MPTPAAATTRPRASTLEMPGSGWSQSRNDRNNVTNPDSALAPDAVARAARTAAGNNRRNSRARARRPCPAPSAEEGSVAGVSAAGGSAEGGSAGGDSVATSGGGIRWESTAAGSRIASTVAPM